MTSEVLHLCHSRQVRCLNSHHWTAGAVAVATVQPLHWLALHCAQHVYNSFQLASINVDAAAHGGVDCPAPAALTPCPLYCWAGVKVVGVCHTLYVLWPKHQAAKQHVDLTSTLSHNEVRSRPASRQTHHSGHLAGGITHFC